MSPECTKANIQSYYEYSVDTRSQHESSQLTGSCSALFYLSHSRCHTLNTFFPLSCPIYFSTCCVPPPTHSSACQYIIPHFHYEVNTLFNVSTLPSVSIIEQIRPHVYFFLTFLSVLMLLCIQSFSL